MGLRTAVGKLDDLITDLTSLHVQTFRGKIVVDKDVPGQDRVKLLREAIKNALAAGGDARIELLMETYVEFDGDTYNFIASDEVSGTIESIHAAAVQSGIKKRQALLELVKDVFA